MPYVLAWLGLYALCNLLGNMTPLPWAQPIAQGLYTAVLLLWCFCSGRGNYIGVKLPRHRLWLYGLPMLVLPVWNLALGLPSLSDTTVCSMFAAIIEELFFRGFALQRIPWKSRTMGLYAVSAGFALLHLVNLNSLTPGLTVLQILFAFSAGLALGGITLRSGSLLPAIIAHMLINLTAIDGVTVNLWVCSGIYLIYGIWLSRKDNKEISL